MVTTMTRITNNADLGMTLQKLICEKYCVEIPRYAEEQFNSNYNPDYAARLLPVITNIFLELGMEPSKCLTFVLSPVKGERFYPHNFELMNGKTLSIRTNKNSDKIAPRVVGQCGIDTFNFHFGYIYDYDVEDKQQIKEIVFNKIHEMLPLFIDYMFMSDYTVWVKENPNGKFEYIIINKNQMVDISLERENFTFTRNLDTWNESTTLKYKDKSLAEIQIHTNRTFKFRFIMTALMGLLKEQEETQEMIQYSSASILENLVQQQIDFRQSETEVSQNGAYPEDFKETLKAREYKYFDIPDRIDAPARISTETLGISAEASICYAFGIDVPENYDGRVFEDYVRKIYPVIKDAFNLLPRVTQTTGATPGERGKNSKCSYDFLLDGDKTLSLKTNTGNMVCPPEVGQPGSETCYLYFKDFIDGNAVTPESFKNMVYKYIDKIIPIYAEHLFDSDYLLWIFKKKDDFVFKIFEKDFASNRVWDKDKFSFTKPRLEEWNESNTVKYSGITIGEFQVHSKRNCYKFRFNLENLSKVVTENIV